MDLKKIGKKTEIQNLCRPPPLRLASQGAVDGQLGDSRLLLHDSMTQFCGMTFSSSQPVRMPQNPKYSLDVVTPGVTFRNPSAGVGARRRQPRAHITFSRLSSKEGEDPGPPYLHSVDQTSGSLS